MQVAYRDVLDADTAFLEDFVFPAGDQLPGWAADLVDVFDFGLGQPLNDQAFDPFKNSLARVAGFQAGPVWGLGEEFIERELPQIFPPEIGGQINREPGPGNAAAACVCRGTGVDPFTGDRPPDSIGVVAEHRAPLARFAVEPERG